MLTLTTRSQFLIGFALVLLMIVTRGHHFATLQNLLPGASWAVFFLAGVYLRTGWPLLGFFALSWWLDFAAYTWGGVSGYCLTPAYITLLLAYSSLWLAGRWYASRHRFEWGTLIPLGFSMMVGLILCELFSSGGFYFFSGRFEETTLVEFGVRVIRYFPLYIESFLFYSGIAVVVHGAFTLVINQINARKATTG